MTRLFDEGRYAEASALYDDSPDPGGVEAQFLRARLHLRAQEPHEALKILNAVRTEPAGQELVWKSMLLGESYACSSDFVSADAHLEVALRAARELGNSELTAEVGYRLGRRYALLSAQPEAANEGLALARQASSLHGRLNALHLESWIRSREGRFAQQARTLSELLSAIDPNAPAHMEHRVRATQTLASLAREIYLPEYFPIIERHLGGCPWPDDLLAARFQAMKAMGWAKALQGDYFNAFRHLKISAEAAPDAAWRCVVLCDRAYLASVRGEHLWFEQELFDAEKAAESVGWEVRRDETPIALLLLAELVAPFDAPRASAYLARFTALGGIANLRALLRGDDRFGALVDYCSGVVNLHLGNRTFAIERLNAARATYERLGYDWRAARCCLRLYELTRKTTFLDRAEIRLRHYMSSWLAEEFRNIRSASPTPTNLSPMRERVFRLLCEGKSNLEIAAILDRKVATIANHAKTVLRTFGVSSRHALVAEAMRQGIIVTPAVREENKRGQSAR